MRHIILVITLICLAFGVENVKEVTLPFYQGMAVPEKIEFSDAAGPTYKLLDGNGRLLAYYQQVNTGVCHDHVCQPAVLSLFWDAAGTFLGFEMPEDVPLTKKDHEEFTEGDYYLLFTILNNPFSVLGETTYEELVEKPEVKSQSVDASTGTTAIADKSAVVAGAAYTCFTLWKIIYEEKLQNYFSAQIEEAYQLEETGKDKLEDLKHMHPAELAIFLKKLNDNGKLKKLSYQSLLTREIDSLPSIHALMINNYIERQIFIYPKTEEALTTNKANEESFLRMINKNSVSMKKN